MRERIILDKKTNRLGTLSYFVKCVMCGKEFWITESQFKDGRGLYCSQKCYHSDPLVIDNFNKSFASFKKGKASWSKGLTKETSIIIKRMAEKRIGDKHPLWKGGRAKMTGGYIGVLIPEHPDANVNGRVLEHRLVMEKKLGRRLVHYEEVHHRNGIKTDNRPENLELVLKYKHQGEIQCPYCQCMFKIK